MIQHELQVLYRQKNISICTQLNIVILRTHNFPDKTNNNYYKLTLFRNDTIIVEFIFYYNFHQNYILTVGIFKISENQSKPIENNY